MPEIHAFALSAASREAVPRYALIRLKVAPGSARVGDRRLTRHGRFGNLHCVPLRSALRLIDTGVAKQLPHQSLNVLRELAAREQAAREQAARGEADD